MSVAPLIATKALKRDLAALERDYREDDDRSPKARAAEAQRAARAQDANRDDRPPQRSWSQTARNENARPALSQAGGSFVWYNSAKANGAPTPDADTEVTTQMPP